MRTLKRSIGLLLILIVSYNGMAQASRSEAYTIQTADEMFGTFIKAGSIVYNQANATAYILTENADATKSLSNTQGKIVLNSGGASSGGMNTFNANICDITDYGALADGETDVSDAIKMAMTEADVIFFPGSKKGLTYVISESLRIPLYKTFKIDEGAMIDVRGNLIGNETKVEASARQIFTTTSNLTGVWLATAAYPEWFGAKSGTIQNSAPAIQKTIDVFHQNIWLTGTNYKVKESIVMGSGDSFYMKNNTELSPSAITNRDLFLVKGEPFIIQGGRINIEQGYNAWVFNVSIDRQGQTDQTPRFTSVIRDIIVEGYMYGQNDFSGMAYNGIKLRSAKKDDYSYFSLMDNVNFYRPDTAIYLSGHDESGMNNSWHWSNITIDWSMRGIILDKKAAGHVFTNLIIQPNTRVKTTQIEVASKYNSFHGVIWDIHSPNTIVLKKGAENNYFSHMGRVDMYERFVKDYSGYKPFNVFSTSNPFEPTKNHYSIYTDEVVGIGIKDNRSSNVPQFTVKSEVANVGAFVKKTSIAGGTDLESSGGTLQNLVLSTQTSDDMIDGFGGGMLFIMKDNLTDSTEYGQNVAARIYARRDGGDYKGMLQFFTIGKNAGKPTMTMRNDGKVGIGTASPVFLLDVNGSLRVSGKVNLEDVLLLKPRSAAPENPKEGELYVNGNDHHIYCYLNGSWKRLD